MSSLANPQLDCSPFLKVGPSVGPIAEATKKVKSNDDLRSSAGVFRWHLTRAEAVSAAQRHQAVKLFTAGRLVNGIATALNIGRGYVHGS